MKVDTSKKELEKFVVAILVLKPPSRPVASFPVPQSQQNISELEGDSKDTINGSTISGAEGSETQEAPKRETTADRLLELFGNLETLVVWLMFARPDHQVRHDNWKAFVASYKGTYSIPQPTELELSDVARRIHEGDFVDKKGKDISQNQKQRMWMIVMERLNMHELHREEKSERKTLSIINEKLAVEAISLDHFNNPVNKSGSLVVLESAKKEVNKRSRRREPDVTPEQRMQERKDKLIIAFLSSIFPMTQQVGQSLSEGKGTLTSIQLEVMQNNRKKICDAAREHWGLQLTQLHRSVMENPVVLPTHNALDSQAAPHYPGRHHISHYPSGVAEQPPLLQPPLPPTGNRGPVFTGATHPGQSQGSTYLHYDNSSSTRYWSQVQESYHKRRRAFYPGEAGAPHPDDDGGIARLHRTTRQPPEHGDAPPTFSPMAVSRQFTRQNHHGTAAASSRQASPTPAKAGPAGISQSTTNTNNRPGRPQRPHHLQQDCPSNNSGNSDQRMTDLEGSTEEEEGNENLYL